MKVFIPISVVLFTTLANLSGQWEIVNEGIAYRLTPTIDFINSDTGWIAGENVVLQTMDGGKNWISYETDTIGDFKSVDFVNDSLGWAINDAGILKTIDGGQNWLVQNDTVGYGKIFTVTENIVYAVIGGEILKTSDGGTDWKNIYSSTSQTAISIASFLNADTGIFAGGKDLDELQTPNEGFILRTFNGGESWIELIIPELNKVLEVKLLNDTTAFFLASDKSGKYFICKTTDAFSTWSVLAENIYPVHASWFFDDGVIIYIMENNLASQIMKSTDGGMTWEDSSVKLPLNWNYQIYFGSETAGYIFGVYQQEGSNGNAHIIMKSTDKGNNWSGLKVTQPFQDVSFINEQTGIIISCDAHIHYRFGNVFITDDGGKTWNNVFSTNSNLPVSCQIPNGSNGYILTYNYDEDGRLGLLQTTDSGETWTEMGILLPYALPVWGWVRDNGRLFMDEHYGFITAQNKIYQTKTSGESWENIYDCGTCELNSIFFPGESTGWAVGESGRIFKYSAPETWDEIPSGTDLPLKKVFFTDANTGWIAGGYKSDDGFHPVLLKTENNGASWIKIENLDYLIHDIYFKDSLYGWVVGEDIDSRGIILETKDGGENWTVQVDSLLASLNAIHFKDGYLWAAGMNGYILKMFDSTSISLAEHHIADNGKDIVIQNYPNPFSSKTMIRYGLPSYGQVEICVYDLTGREVTALVKEIQQAGKHEVEWNASGIKPGIYFCVLKAGQSRKVMKMILLK